MEVKGQQFFERGMRKIFLGDEGDFAAVWALAENFCAEEEGTEAEASAGGGGRHPLPFGETHTHEGAREESGDVSHVPLQCSLECSRKKADL